MTAIAQSPALPLAALLTRAHVEGGFTVDAATLEPVTHGIAVGGSRGIPSLTMSAERLSRDTSPVLAEYRDRVLAAGHSALGGWIDPRGALVLDAVDVFTDEAEAAAVARERGEEAYFNLTTGTETFVA